jgi:hypothetical protein
MPPDEIAETDELAELTVVDVPELRRFEARLGSQTIGHTRYARAEGRIALVHTEIDPSVEGKGYGSRLAAAVLAEVRSRDLSVIVTCPFIAAYVRRHVDEYPEVDVRA